MAMTFEEAEALLTPAQRGALARCAIGGRAAAKPVVGSTACILLRPFCAV